MLTKGSCFFRDAWLSKVMNKACYSFDLRGNEEYLKNDIDHLKSEFGQLFFYTKVNVSDISAIRRLQSLDSLFFYLVDTNVTLQKKIDKSLPIDGQRDEQDSSLECLLWDRDSPREEILNLSGKSFSLSRFHLDPLVDNEMANLIKREWILSYFLGNRGDYLIVCKKGTKIAGFVSLIQMKQKVVIDLIAVGSEFRRCGVATKLTNYVVDSFDEVLVGTQLSNSNAIRLYEKNYFRIIDSKYVFHSHYSS